MDFALDPDLACLIFIGFDNGRVEARWALDLLEDLYVAGKTATRSSVRTVRTTRGVGAKSN
jgi:hypothetical protein